MKSELGGPFSKLSELNVSHAKVFNNLFFMQRHKWRYNYKEKVENIVTKGENAHNEQVPLLSHRFQKSSAAEASEK